MSQKLTASQRKEQESLLKSIPDMAQLAKMGKSKKGADIARGPRKRGPRKRREVQNQADVAVKKYRRRRERPVILEEPSKSKSISDNS